MSDRVWYCKNCELEYDIDGEGVKILTQRGNNNACIRDAEGRAHNITRIEWATIQRRRHCILNAIDVGVEDGDAQE